jgi:polar amino acid transport system permease protein
LLESSGKKAQQGLHNQEETIKQSQEKHGHTKTATGMAWFRDLAKFSVTSAIFIWLIHTGASTMEYNWQWYRIPKYIATLGDQGFVPGPLLTGLGVTLKVSFISLLLSSLFGLMAALCRLSNLFSLRALARLYLELIRNTPLLVQLFFIYFVLSPAMGFSRFAAAVVTLGLFEGAYASEIIRAGITAIPKGQWEAAISQGLGRYHTYRHIILPQAVRIMLPPLTSQMISLIKDSALVSTIAVYDLTMKGQEIMAETYLVFEIWLAIAAIYLAITLTLSMVTHAMEKKLSPNL